MTEDIKGLVKRLGYYRENPATGKLELANPNGPEAADAIEALAGEVETLKTQQAADDAHAQRMTVALKAFLNRAEAAEAERDRLQLANARMKAALVRLKMHIGPGYEYAILFQIIEAALGDAS